MRNVTGITTSEVCTNIEIKLSYTEFAKIKRKTLNWRLLEHTLSRVIVYRKGMFIIQNIKN